MQTDLFQIKTKALPYSILPNLIRSRGKCNPRVWECVKFGFYYRSVGMSCGLEELIKIGKFEQAKGKGLKFTYTDENGTLIAYLQHKYIGDIMHISLYGKTASETGYRSYMVMTSDTIDEAIEQMPEFVKKWHTELLGFEKKKVKKGKKS